MIWLLILGCALFITCIAYIAIGFWDDDELDSMRGENWMAENAEYQDIKGRCITRINRREIETGATE